MVDNNRLLVACELPVTSHETSASFWATHTHRGSALTFAWREIVIPFRKKHPHCSQLGLNPNLPVLGSTFYRKCNALDDMTTEASYT
uniref:(California timema) hypothetical protein n=1 Tax=Timema californicum TaxID=61474 RepID=A0A7R9PB44_TIMCA|nr:unnamed protein product [Timema californicum]